MQDAVYVVIGLVLLVFVFLLGSLGRERERAEPGRLAAELEVERRRVRELQEEVDRLRELVR